MKFNNDKEKVIYYWKKAKMFKKNGDKVGYIEYLIRAHELKEKIEKENSKV